MATPTQPQKPATSMDKAEISRWRFNETNGFIAKDWTGRQPGEEPVIVVLKATDVFEYIAEAARDNKKVAIYTIGACILDWS